MGSLKPQPVSLPSAKFNSILMPQPPARTQLPAGSAAQPVDFLTLGSLRGGVAMPSLGMQEEARGIYSRGTGNPTCSTDLCC